MPVPPHHTFRARPALLAAFLLVALVPGEASANRTPTPTPTPADARAPATTWTSSEPDNATCQRTRRKLWQVGEGWIVRGVTVCR